MIRTEDWKWFYLQLIAVILLCAIFPETATQAEVYEPKVVCYYTNWSVYRPGEAKFSPQNINPYLCTHLIYAFGGFTKDSALKPFDKYQDIEQGGYAKFTGLKTYNKQLKTLLAIGGWNEASSRFSPMVASSEKRHLFARNAIKYLRQNHFDGLDLDWEYPAFRDGGKPRDRANYAQFVQELREEFDREANKTGRPRLLLTMAVPAGEEYVEKGLDIPKLNQYLDWFNLLTYDYHSSQEPSVAHHAPLYPLEDADDEYNFDAGLNIDSTIQFYLQKGASPRKLVLGLPTYGRSYTLFNPEATELGSPTDGPGEQGDATREKGYLAYYEICQGIKEDPEWTVVHPNPSAMGPYAYNADQWVGYDDEQMASRKGEYAAVNKLGGIMFWSIDNDDFRGDCTGKPYPIIEAAKNSYYASLGLVAKDVIPKSRGGVKTLSSNKIRKPGKESSFSDVKIEKESSLSSRRNSRKRPTTDKPVSRDQSEEILFVGVAQRTTTPAPPTTPSPGGGGFKCESEGFFANPKDCKKYYWCLDSGPSMLGIVANHFTCPGGLIFNSETDSCDYSRNVKCKMASSEKAATTRAPVTTTTVKSSTYKVNPITLRSSNFRTTTQRTTTEAAEEYYDEEVEGVEEEEEGGAEDPAVLKELVQLINKAGGISNLEKQLLVHKNGSVMYKDPNAPGAYTTVAPISASLYDKILTRNQVRKEYQPIRSRQQFGSSTENVVDDEATPASTGVTSTLHKEYQSIRSRQNFASSTENTVEETTLAQQYQKQYQSIRSRQNFAPNTDNIAIASTAAPSGSPTVTYSGFSFNSRSGPQNQGIEQLDEFAGLLRDKPKYTVLSRNKSPATESVEDVTDSDDLDIVPETTTAQRGIFQFQYVSLQRKNSEGASHTTMTDDKTDFTVAGIETTIRPFTASAPRGFASRYSTINRQNPVDNPTTIDEKLLFEDESTEVPVTEAIPVTTTTTAAPTTRTLFPAFRRKTSVSPDEDTVEEDSTTITPYTETTETYPPETPSLSLTETHQPEKVEEANPIPNSQTDAPETIGNDLEESITEIPNDILPIRPTFRPRLTFPTTSPTTTTPRPTFEVSSNAPQVPEEKTRRPLKIRPTRGPFRPNDILPRGRAVTQSADQEESHSEASFQTVTVEKQTYNIRGRGQSRYQFKSIANTLNEGFVPRESKDLLSTPALEVVSSTAAPNQPRVRSRRPDRPSTTESYLQEVTKQIQRGRGFTSRARPTTTSEAEFSTLAPEIPSPRNQPRRFESRFSGNDFSSTDSPIIHIHSVSDLAADTTTSVPPIRITLNSALNFGYANKKQFRQQVFTVEDNEAKEKSVKFNVQQDDSPVIRPAVNVRFGVHVKETIPDEKGSTKGDLEAANLVTKQMERDDVNENIYASTVAPEEENFSTRRTTIGIVFNEDLSDDFKDSMIESQTFIPLEEETEEQSGTTVGSTLAVGEEQGSTIRYTQEQIITSTPQPSRGRTRLNVVRRRPTADSIQTEENASETPTEVPNSNNRFSFRSQRRRTTTSAPQSEGLEDEEEQSVQGSSTPRNRFTNIRRRTTTEATPFEEENGDEIASQDNEEQTVQESSTPRNRFTNIRRRTTTEATLLEEGNRDEIVSQDKKEQTVQESSTPRNRFTNIRRRTTTEATLLEEGHRDENVSQDKKEQTVQDSSTPRNRFTNIRRRTTTETTPLEEGVEGEVASPATPSIRPRQRPNYVPRNRQNAQVNEQEVTRGEQLKTLEESLTLNPLGSTRNRFNGNNRFRTTTEAEVLEQETLTITASSTFSPRSRSRFIAGRARTTATTPVEVTDDEQDIAEEVPHQQQVNRFQSRFQTKASTTDRTEETTDVEEEQVEEESTTKLPFNKFRPLLRQSFTTTASPAEELEAVTLNDEEEMALHNQLKEIRSRYTTSAPETEETSTDDAVTDESVTATEDEVAVTDSVPITTANRFQSLKNRFSSTTSTAATPSEAPKEEEKKEVSPVTSRTSLSRQNVLRTRFSGSTTESSVSEAVDEDVINSSSTASSRFRNFQSRTRGSITEASEVTEEGEVTPSTRPESRKRIVKRPRQRTTEGDAEVTQSGDAVSTTERNSFRTSRRRLPVVAATEATISEVNNEDQEITQEPRQTTRGRNIRPSLFSRNRLNVESQKVDEIAPEEENHEAPVENQGRVTYRKRIVKKKKTTEAPAEVNEDPVDDQKTEDVEAVEQPKKRKIIRRLRTKSTPSGEEQESATESLSHTRGDESGTEQSVNESTESTRPTSRTTLRRGKTQDLGKTLEELRKNRAKAQAEAQKNKSEQGEDIPDDEQNIESSSAGTVTTRGRYSPRTRVPFVVKRPTTPEQEQGEDVPENDEDQPEGEDGHNEDNSSPTATTRARGSFTARSRAPYSPKLRAGLQSTTEAITPAASPSPRNRFSSRVKFGRKSPGSNGDETITAEEKAEGQPEEEDAISVSNRPLNFNPSKDRVSGPRFRNTYKGTPGKDDEVRTVLKPSARPYQFANRSRFRGQAQGQETSTSEKENNVDFEQATEAFDDQQYVDDNYEGVTESESEVSAAPESLPKKKANVPISINKAQRPLYTPKIRKQNVPSTLRKPNLPQTALKTDTTSSNGRKANSPVVPVVVDTNKDTEAVESTTLDRTQEAEDTETQTEAQEGEGHTDETNGAINLQEYYARGGNGTPTPGPLAHLLNRPFKLKKHPSTTTKPTTLHHVFAIDVGTENKSGEASKNQTEASSEQVSKKLRKLIEVNRIVEVNSKQQKVSPSEASDELGLVAEKLPTLDRIGEISRLAVVKLKTAEREGKAVNILLPEMIFGVETSTISLEGLFEKDRKAKELVVKEEKDEHNNTINVVYARTVTQQDSPVYTPTSPLTTTTTTETPAAATEKYNNVVRPLVPMLRPESSDDNPYVITIANLDQVILSKVGAGLAGAQPTTTEEGVTTVVAGEDSTTVSGEY